MSVCVSWSAFPVHTPVVAVTTTGGRPSQNLKKQKTVWPASPDKTLLTKRDLMLRWECSLDTIKRRQRDPEFGLVAVKLGHRSVRFRLSDIERIEAEALTKAPKTARRTEYEQWRGC